MLFALVTASMLTSPTMRLQRVGTGCDGQTVSTVSIDPERPPFSGASRKWQVVARALGLHHATTRNDVVKAYLLVKAGDVCSEERLAASEHMLRELPFLSSAHVVARADSSNGVVVEVRTTDEIPVLLAGSLRHGIPAALALGNENVGGLGLRLLVGAERSGVYRGAARFEAIDYGLFGLPLTAQARAERGWLGESGTIDVAQPFLSDFQRGAWHVAFSAGHDFPIVLRPVGDNLAAELQMRRWSASGLIKTLAGRTPSLWGPVAFGLSVTPSNRLALVTDSGAVAVTDSLVSSHLATRNATWIGGLFGLRHVTYVTRTGIDALFGAQDMLSGWEAGVVAAPDVRGHRDALLATSIRAGFAGRRLAFIADLEAENERGIGAGAGNSAVGNLNASGYFTPSSAITISVRDNLSRATNAWIPAQLSLGDPIGGPRGYIGSQIAGGVRNLTRTEIRGAIPSAIHNADIGAAVFFDAAQMWAGDVAYGATTSAQSFGLSLLAAYPSHSKRIYRVDVAFPLRRLGGHGVGIRFGSGDPTIIGTLEPSDVTQLRVAPIPSSIFGWTP